MMGHDSKMDYLRQFEFYEACYGEDGGLYERFVSDIAPAIIAAKNEVNQTLGSDLTSEQFCTIAIEIIDALSTNGNLDMHRTRSFREKGLVNVNGDEITLDVISARVAKDWCHQDTVREVTHRIFDEQGNTKETFE